MQELLDSVKSLSIRERKALSALLKRQGVNLYGVTPIFRRESESSSALSYAQQRQWILWQLEPGSAAYNIPTALRLKGSLDTEALRRSFEALIRRHETLRTTLRQDAGQVLQVIHPADVFSLAPERLAPPVAEDLDEQIRACVAAEVQRPFDLEHGPLLRVRLLQISEDDHVLILTLHHIVCDGWSMPIMVDELVSLYDGFRQGREVELAALPIQYADYAQWQRDWMEAGEQERQLGYWKGQLGGEQPVLELPIDRPRPTHQSLAGQSLAIDLPAPLAQSLKAVARQQGVTLFMLLLASFQTLLHRYCGQTDIRVGVAIANRSRVETEGLIGFFVNTQVLRAEIDAQVPFAQLLQQVKRTALDAQAHQDLPFEQLVEALQPERSLNRTPLFQVMYNHQTQVRGEVRELAGLRVEGLPWEKRTAQFDLALDTFESDAGLGAAFTYASDLFEQATIERLAGHWRCLLEAIGSDPQQRIAALPMLDRVERQHTLRAWNPAPAAYPATACAHELIEAQALKAPDALAVTHGSRSLTYGELNRRANQLAHHLRACGVGPDGLVGLAVDRGLEMLVGLLAILKAGGAYVPLDPDYPEDRLAYMIEDSRIRLLLTQSHLLGRLPIPDGVHSLCLDQEGDWLEGYPQHNLPTLTDPDNLAYVIYTSGSTGKPKGTLLPHRNILRLFQATDAWFGFGPQDVWTMFHSYAFDFSVWEIFGALMHGGRLVIVPRDISRSPQDFYPLLLSEGVTVLNQTPSAFKQLARVACEAPPSSSPLPLRYVVFGGEALDVGSLQPWFERFGDRSPQLVNMYGITETTVHVTYRPIGREDLLQAGVSPIGEVIPDLSWYVLDADFNPVAQGCSGELHVGRAGLARGYHQRPALTAERFVPDPFDEQGGGRLYRAGDLARYRAEGCIEYIGRLDHQVKIRGFRIELGEIDARLREHAAVREVSVVDIDGPGGKQLAAYLVPSDPLLLDADPEVQGQWRRELREHLKSVLPDYMVPAHWILLRQMPLTANGKLDRRALPAPDVAQAQKNHVAPVTAVQQQVAQIWAEVLKIERVGLDDNFFELGGHSLLATQVISRIRQSLALELSLRDLFEAQDLAAFVRKAEGGSAVPTPIATIERADRTQPLLLSHAQQRQWFLWQLDPDSAAYNIPAALQLSGTLDVEALRRSFETLIARHETLRSTFREEGEQTVQVIHPLTPFDLPVEHLSDISGPERAAAIREYVEREAGQAFDLVQGPLLRVRLLRVEDTEHVLVLTVHHIVSDGWSTPIMVDELVRLYSAYHQGSAADLADLPVQYADYALWQRRWMAEGEQARQLDYWTGQLGGEQPVLELPIDRPRPTLRSHVGERLAIELPPELVDALKAVARQQGVTLFVLLLASFQTLLHRYSGQADIRVGVPIANRNRVETERLIGFFVNTQVLRAGFTSNMTFSELLQQVRQAALEAQAHQDLPFEQLVEALQPERSLSHSPLFQVIYNHQAEGPGELHRLPGLTVQGLSWGSHVAQFDLALDTHENTDGLSAALTYSSALFDPATIARMAAHWRNLLGAIAAGAHRRVVELPILSDDERQRIVVDWNQSEASYPTDRCIHQLIAEQSRETPQAAALLFDDAQMSYQQLDLQSNRLARKLRELGVGPDVLVGVALERGPQMLVGLLAILKAGGAYVPLDPDFPADRLAYMVQDSGLTLLLTQRHLSIHQAVGAEVRSLFLDQAQDWLGEISDAPLVNLAQPDNLAYVIYTSGSTGKPKGVAVSHGALVNFLFSMAEQPGVEPSDRVLSLTSLSFDIAGLELYLTLMRGAAVVLLRQQQNKDPQALLEVIGKHQVSVIQATPSTWRMLLDSAPPGWLAGCKVLCGGEALSAELAQRLIEQAGHVWNVYGPTETTIWSARHYLTSSDDIWLGRPIANTRLHILSDDFDVLPPGARGELLIGGDGLARGYHQRPGLTAERFIPDPFDPQGGGRLYRTGDLTFYHDDGVIEYAGRLDHQVKIRGFRIELGEIEARLQEHAAVREAVVIDIDGPAGKQLAAYLVAEDTSLLQATAASQEAFRRELKELLKAGLPDYMVPSHLILLERLPLTPNGKVDRKALPAPQADLSQSLYLAPQTPLEQALAQIWQAVLKVERVGLGDNFFELGGHSLIATQVISRVRQGLEVELPLRALFEADNLAEFAERVAQGTLDKAPALLPIGRDRPLALSYAQQRQWFLWQLDPDSAAYNIPAALRLEGPLDVEALRRSFEALCARHEVLRTTFRQDGERAVQVIHPAVAFTLAVDACALSAGEADIARYVDEEIRRPFDLEQGPLLRVKLLRLAPDAHVLVLTVHHIVADGWSMPVMVDELVQGYEAHSQGRRLELPALPIQYADYAEWQRQWMEAGEQRRQLDYWQAQLGGEQPVLELPLDRPRPTQQSHAGDRLSVELDTHLVQTLKATAREQGVTLFMLLLASFQTLLQRYSGQADIRVGVPVANRTRVETERLIGFFVNTQVLKAEFTPALTFTELLQQVKRTALQAQGHQDLPFEQLVEALQPERSLSHSPLFQVMYNHQSQVSGEGHQLSGLSVQGLALDSHTAQFDLTLDTSEHEQGVGATLTYATALFDRSTVERMARHWRRLLAAISSDATQRVADLPLLSEAERQQIEREWNQTAAAYPAQACVQGLIEAQVARTPEDTALIWRAGRMSYRQLDQRSNQLAHTLRQAGVGPDVLVGIAVERGPDMLVGLLAILKAGGAYVPLDPDFPQDRLAYMMQDSGLQLLLTQSPLLEHLPLPEGVRSLCLDLEAQWRHGVEDAPLANLAMPDNLAYVIYTSGSTGKPKGVAVRHEGLTNFLFSMAEQPGIDARDRVLSLTSLSFDIAGLELYLPLMCGASVVLLDNGGNKDPQALVELIEHHAVTLIQATPSTWRMLLDQAPAGFLAGRKILCGGEALSAELAQRLIEQAGHVWNVYGPTETTIWSAAHYLTASDDVWLGRPIANTQLHILGEDFDTLPLGARGELLIGGHGLARGYHQRPGLTAERFVPDPFDEQGGGRLYRTGDLTRYREQGVIEYVSRLDHQVKIRGFRIELGEIEARLQEHAAVRESSVIDLDGPTGKQLAAYLVLSDAGAGQPWEALHAQLKAHLKAGLPDYMVPTHLVLLERMPLTPNGKLDRKALPLPDARAVQRRHVAPRTELEQRLADIWAQLLKVETVGLNDNFFELGGHSLLVISLVGRLREAFDVTLKLHDFLLMETLADLADFMREGEAKVQTPVISMNGCRTDRAPLFCLPPGGGGTYSYYPLAGRLKDNRRVYGLVNKSYVVPGWFDRSWDEMVGYYVQQIRQTQPEGPYNLLGWSLGGALAMEVAHVLEQGGDVVSFLGLVDTSLPAALEVFAPEPEPAPDVAQEDQSLFANLVGSLLAFVPGIEEQTIVGLIEQARAQLDDEQAIADWVIDQVALAGGVSAEGLREVYRDIAVQDEIETGYRLLRTNALLSEAFTLKPLQVKPDCWWAGASKTAQEIGAAQAVLVEQCARNGLGVSTALEENHDSIILSQGLLTAVLERLKLPE
ncbi:amino acid adenylation domain-containing protein [Pseudomonas fuscovaginae UPB0736]|uniref:amino acid adenylation domain-containing protein n=4 Tax=Pseudomonas asplenii TaxID=53407 RepID=UPI00211DAA71|nr:non-ribosomal peptide synthetase [Pseudomonas fuscovaginae]UUQ65882.1 amino acid adenylation domain-containing protein [Pseudomonas fuscovaginae UPB0736]